jgi:ketosteroid isomerase-like protein
MKLIIVVSLLTATSLGLTFDEASDAKKAIEARFGQISKAFSERNLKSVETIFTEDFKAKSPGKPVSSRAQFFKDFEIQMKLMSGVKWSQKVKKFTLEKGVAFVLIDSEMKSKVDSEEGKPQDFRIVSKTKNEWVKGKQGWQIRYSESVELNMWLDGKELNPGH